MARKKEETMYLITYRNAKDAKVVTLKAKTVTDSSLGLSFVAISDFLFDTKSVVINPEEEDQKRQFEGMKTLHLSIYSIVSIEEVGEEHKGLKFKKDKSNLVVLTLEQPQPSGK
ncbi:MAG: hypothetical protein COX19_03175 [Desulfobacterales bacterium CG23_combo_of_CG06-09_8_20_14_all_51_8]|nr:MAG: hypothetical protein COX19_03175 [Desulfobacterales bacterium CG23_combo_of_CG06-09_8_20_14_all_51_8]